MSANAPWGVHHVMMEAIPQQPTLIVGVPDANDPDFYYPICLITPLDKCEPHDLQRANLIAAAPDLLSALQDITDAFVEAAVLSGTDRELAEVRAQAARAAIAKATGGAA